MASKAFEEEQRDEMRIDNDFLRMKLMLERGAKFGVVPGSGPVAPEVENRFLRDILEFESLNEKQAFISLYEKIGKPSCFPPAGSISEADMPAAWSRLLRCLGQHQITVGVCTPHVKTRELYRFVTEELFFLQISSVNMPGLVHGFIYDEFHPDPYYDNPRTALEGCIEPLFADKPLQSMHFFRKFDLRLNDHYPLSQREFRNLLNNFKHEHGPFDSTGVKDIVCTVENDVCNVSGKYQTSSLKALPGAILQGNWMVELTENTITGVWDITGLHIDGVSL